MGNSSIKKKNKEEKKDETEQRDEAADEIYFIKMMQRMDDVFLDISY